MIRRWIADERAYAARRREDQAERLALLAATLVTRERRHRSEDWAWPVWKPTP